MRNRVIGLMSALVLLFSFAALAQAPAGQRQGGRGNAAPAAAATGPFDPHDLSGIWRRRGGDRSISQQAPALTPEGEARMMKNIPARKRITRTASTDVPSESNDPAFACNPKGFPRMLIDTAHDWHEVVQVDGRILQLWQEERRPREIWTDGRAVPS